MERILEFLPKRPQPVLVRYGTTTVIVVVSCLLQYAVYHISGYPAFFLQLPGIFLSGILFDRGSGFFATMVGVAMATYLLPISAESSSLVPLLAFIAVGFTTAFSSESLRKLLERLAGAEQAQVVLLRELDHRTKNNMMNIVALLQMQRWASRNQETKDALETAANRIRLMADVHGFLLPHDKHSSVDMSQFLTALVGKLGDFRADTSVKLHLDSAEIVLPDTLAVPIAIVANEMITNSLKHAFPNGNGNIYIRMHQDGQVVLSVRDDGVGCGQATKPGIGSRLMQLMAQQMGGILSREPGKPGCIATLRVNNPWGKTLKPRAAKAVSEQFGEARP
jgi:two-component sensor histidine kinase